VFRFTVSAADLRPGDYPVVIMRAQDGSALVVYALVQLDPNGDG
jgi:hypothetical protein